MAGEQNSEILIERTTAADAYLVDVNGVETFLKTIIFVKGDLEKNINFTFTREGKFYLRLKWRAGMKIKESLSNQFVVTKNQNINQQ